MTKIIPISDINFLQGLSQDEANRTASQMTTVLSAISQERAEIDGLVSMLNNQPWWKRCIRTISGRNRATGIEIREHSDKITAYTLEAILYLCKMNIISGNQMISIQESVNQLNYCLANTNDQLVQTQRNVYMLKNELNNSIYLLSNKVKEKSDETKRDINNLMKQMIDLRELLSDEIADQSNEIKGDIKKLRTQMLDVKGLLTNEIADLSNKTNLAINSLRYELWDAISELSLYIIDIIKKVDSFHMLIEEINLGNYEDFGSLFLIISQINSSFANDERKMDILKKSLRKARIISKRKVTLASFISKIATVPSEIADVVYQELNFSESNVFSDVFSEIMEKYTFITGIDRRALSLPDLVESICKKHCFDSNALFSSEEIYDYFVDIKKGLLHKSIYDVEEIFITGNYKAAFPLLKQFALNGNTRSYYMLGLYYQFGFDTVKIDKNITKQYFLKLEKEDDPVLKMRYADYILSKEDNCSSEINNEVFDKLKSLAENGDVFAQTELGYMFKNGFGTTQNLDEAVKWFKRAAMRGYSIAQRQLGTLNDIHFKEPLYIEDNINYANKWYELSANQGNAESQYDLGWNYYNEFGDEADKLIGENLLRKAAKQGEDQSQDFLKEEGLSG